MRRLKTYIAVIVAVIALAAAPGRAVAQAPARTPVWEVVELTDNPEAPADGPGVSVTEVDGPRVYIEVERPVTVKVFSILGQLISQRTLQPGTYRLTIRSKGIYILKADEYTKRINI